MRFLISAVIAAIAILPAFSAPASLLEIQKYSGEKTGKYIVTLKPGATKSSVLKSARGTATHEWDIINGFAGVFTAEELEALRSHADVESIAEDGYVTVSVTQTNAPWGLSRLSATAKLSNQDPEALNYQYTYDESAGRGVDIYIIDTGINIEHVQFGGRARWGATFGPYPNEDDHGHGTHCAGIAASAQFGVAKQASLIAVKVMNKDG
ncbi:hypothetical protein H0H87_000400 [Tephrocybe sp. NHM501043]|nr:hypothetical protein H0H87_000400 [Tephrocybe sp. NHM501043]